LSKLFHAGYLIKTGNVGDDASCPLLYLNIPGWTPDFCDCRSVPNDGLPVVVGGGGLFHPGIDDVIEKLVLSGRPVILWGAGLNYHMDFLDLQQAAREPPDYPEWVKRCAAVGVRDLNSDFRWCPCASCMHPEFDRERLPVRDIVVYEHQASPIPVLLETPRMRNTGGFEAVKPVLDFLGSARTVVTNTYHGCYWSALMGKRVICWKPFSTRFLRLGANVELCGDGNVENAIAKAAAGDANYLHRCRTAVLEFHKVCSSLACFAA